MPVPKGVDKKKFDSCVENVKAKQGKKVNAYAVCNTSLSKAEEAIVDPTTVEAKVETQTAAPTEVKAEEAPVEVAQPKLANGLFGDFTLGSNLKPSTVGNVISNVKRSPIDYEKTYQNSTKNQKFTSEQLKELAGNKDKK